MSGIEVSIKVGGDEVLSVTSDGMANFHVVGDVRHEGSSPVGDKREYYTSDDLNVVGQVIRHLSASLAREVLRKAISDRRQEVES